MSKRYFDITSDNELWRRRCFQESSSPHVHSNDRIRSRSVTRQIPERRVLDLQQAFTRSSGTKSIGHKHRGCSARRLQAGHAIAQSDENIRDDSLGITEWDSTSPGETVIWRSEYIARHGPMALNWLCPLTRRSQSGEESLEARGFGVLSSKRVLAPLEDGSVFVWDAGDGDDGFGNIIAHSRPGILLDDHIRDREWRRSSPRFDSTAVECVSIGEQHDKAYVAVGKCLNEVDLHTLQISACHRFLDSITVLSDISSPAPLTLGLPRSIHLHDPRTGVVPLNSANGVPLENSIHKMSDLGLTSTGSPKHAIFPHHFPLSILHTGTHMIHVAGRFPSIINIDRRSFPNVLSTVYSGATISSLACIPLTDGHVTTIGAAGEYRGRGSLELYPVSSESGCLAKEPLRNRISTSGSKCLSLTPHGTRLLFSDSNGLLKWVERDSSTPVRTWNLNAKLQPTSSGRDQQARASGIFNAEVNAGDVVRKLVPFDCDDAKSDVTLWTGERIGVLRVGLAQRHTKATSGGPQSFDEDGEQSSSAASDEERDYSTMMRRALERQAVEVRFVQGLGLGRSL